MERAGASHGRLGSGNGNGGVPAHGDGGSDASSGRDEVFRRLTDRPADLLRFATAGSVDDGKSTLIGRLLFDSSRCSWTSSSTSSRRASAWATTSWTSRCSPTACAPSASRASRSTSRTATSRPRSGASSSPTLQGTSNTRATWSRRLHGGPRDRARGRAQGRRRAVQAARVHQLAARDPARGRVREQDGPRRLPGEHLRRDRRGLRPLRRAPGDAGRDLHPDLGAARRQRRRALGEHALVPRAAAALPPRARAHCL